MQLLTALIISVIVSTSYTMMLSVITKVQNERERVRQGYPPLNDFEYFYLIVPYLLSTSTLVVSAVILSLYHITVPNNIWYIILTVMGILLIHTLASMLGTAVVAFFQSRQTTKKLN